MGDLEELREYYVRTTHLRTECGGSPYVVYLARSVDRQIEALKQHHEANRRKMNVVEGHCSNCKHYEMDDEDYPCSKCYPDKWEPRD